MAKPKYTEIQIWKILNQLKGHRISSLTKIRSHRIVFVDNETKTYEIEYESGNRKSISLKELYSLYRDLYLSGSLTNSYMKENANRILGWPSWHAPGSAMMAILPYLDDSINRDGGSLKV